MRRTENECVDCELPCKGDSCPHRNVTRFYCDECDDETVLYEFEGQELCMSCIDKILVKERIIEESM